MKITPLYCTLGLFLAGITAQGAEKKDAHFSFTGVPEGSAGIQTAKVPIKVKKIALFKNGYGFYNMTVSVPEDSSGLTAITPTGLPCASHGTFWPDDQSRGLITHTLSHKKKKEVSRNNFSIMELAQSNPGAKIRIKTEKGEVLEGKISTLRLSGEKSSVPSRSYSIEDYYEYSNRNRSFDFSSQTSAFLTLQQESSLIVLSERDIRQIEFLEQTELNTPTYSEEVPQIDLFLNNAKKGMEIGLSCVAKGITWLPAYQIDISEPGHAKFQGNAVIINESMDIDEAEMELITGVPFLQFAPTPSPIFMQLTFPKFFEALTRPEQAEAPFAYGYNISGTGSISTSGGRSSSQNDPDQMLKNLQSEDLFFYPIKRFSCKKNETVTLPLFSGKVPYTHLYTWDIPLDKSRSWESSSREEAPQDDIWHCLKITNSLRVPLTTSPIEFISAGRIVGQSTMPFTATGESAKVKINKSMEFTTEKMEKVTSQTRKKDALDYSYVEIAIEGQLHISNLADKTVTIEITKNLQGQNIQTPEGGEVTHSPNYDSSYNLNGSIKWTIELQPKEKKTLTYTYLYLRR